MSPVLAIPIITPLIRGAEGAAVRGFVDVIAAPVAAAAAWILKGLGALIAATTRPQLDRTWFQARYSVMVALAVVTLVGVLSMSAVHAVVRQDPGLVVRVMLVQLPLAVILTGAAAGIVQWSLSFVDLLCRAITADTGHDLEHLFLNMERSLLALSVGAGPSIPAFVTLIVSLLVVVGGLLLWMELLLRSIAVDAATLFLPLAMVTLAWPAASRIARRLAETIAALVLSKLVIVGILSLAVSALASGGFGAVLTGMGLLLLAAAAPYTLLRLIPLAEFGAVTHLEGLTRRATVRPVMQAWTARSLVPAGGSGPGFVGPVEDRQEGGGHEPSGLSSPVDPLSRGSSSRGSSSRDSLSPGSSSPAALSSPGMARRGADWYGPVEDYSPSARVVPGRGRAVPEGKRSDEPSNEPSDPAA